MTEDDDDLDAFFAKKSTNSFTENEAKEKILIVTNKM